MPSELSSEQSGSAKELQKYLILTNNSNHYQLLGVTADSSQKDIKYSFYCLARKFHPDRHMSRPDWVGPLQHLMAALPKAYVVLRDDHKRNNYGKQLALASIRSEAEESIDDSVKLAVNCQRDANIPGAIFWLRKCIILAPKDAKHRMSLGVILATMPLHRREAVEQLNKAVELDAWNADAYLQLGEVYEVMLLLLPWRSRVLRTKVLDLYPEHAMARQRLEKVSGEKKKPMSRLISSWFKK